MVTTEQSFLFLTVELWDGVAGMAPGFVRADLRVTIADPPAQGIGPRRVSSTSSLSSLTGSSPLDGTLENSRARAKAAADAQMRVLLEMPLMRTVAQIAVDADDAPALIGIARRLTAEQRTALAHLRALCVAFLETKVADAAPLAASSDALSSTPSATSSDPEDQEALCARLLREAQALRAPLAALVPADEVNLSTRFVVASTATNDDAP